MDRDFKGIWIPKEIYLNEELNWTEKILLVEIDSLSNINGCFASNDHFAKHLNVSKDRISKIISKLVKLGYITSEIIYKPNSKQVEKRVLYSNLSYSYKVHLEGIGKNTYRGIGVNTYRGIGKNTEDNNTIYKNTNINKNSNNSKVIMDKWNSIGLSKIIKIENQRLKHLNARIEEYSLDIILEAIDKVSNSDFLKGFNNKNWKADIDWLLNPNNFIKVIEGKYDNKVNKPKKQVRKSETNWDE